MIRVGADFEAEFPGADRLATECYANVVRTGDRLIALHNRQAWEDYRLSASAKMALAVIEGADGPLEPSVIAERLIITSGSMTSVLDTLERRGLVRRMPHPDDRRKLLVEVTDEAVAILDEMLPSLHQRERALMDAALTKEEQRRLLGLLAKVQQAAEDMADRPPIRAERVRRPRIAGRG
jgi:DNA-binding MarR family transcriptional regulator